MLARFLVKGEGAIVNDEFSKELQRHIEMHTADNIRSNLTNSTN